MGRRTALTLLALLFSAGCIGTNPFQAARDRRLMKFDLNAMEQSLGPVISPAPAAQPPSPPDSRLSPNLGQLVSDLETATPTNLSLEEALAVTMQNSTIVRSFSGSPSSSTTTSVTPNAVTSYDPAINKANLDAALAAFDATVTASGFYNRINQPTGSFLGPGIPVQDRFNEGGVSASLNKPLTTGGLASVAYNPPVGYLFLPQGTNTGFFNPEFVSNLEVKLIQPLLRNAGPQFNRAPIRIAHLQTDQAAWNSKLAVMDATRSVVQAYWNLQAAYIALRAIDETLPLLDEMVRVQEANFAAERVIRADVAKAQGQWHLYKQQQLGARLSIVQNELTLRNLMGLPPADGRRLVPVTPAARARVRLNVDQLMNVALQNRPDLVSQRLNVRVRDLQLLIARNGLKPQLDVTSLYRMNGLSNTLGGSLNQLSNGGFDDYQVALNFSVAIGRRAAAAAVRGATLQMEKETAQLRQSTFAVSHEIGNVLRQIEFVHQQFIEADLRFRGGDEWVRGARLRYQNPLPGPEGQNWLLTALNDYLMALQFRASAMTDAAAFLARYNGLLAQLDESLGRILELHGIEMINDPLLQTVADKVPLARVREPSPTPMSYVSDKLSKMATGDAEANPGQAPSSVQPLPPPNFNRPGPDQGRH